MLRQALGPDQMESERAILTTGHINPLLTKTLIILTYHTVLISIKIWC